MYEHSLSDIVWIGPLAEPTGRRLAGKDAGLDAAISSVIETEAAASACAWTARLNAVS
jgi:hypothetical protein